MLVPETVTLGLISWFEGKETLCRVSYQESHYPCVMKICAVSLLSTEMMLLLLLLLLQEICKPNRATYYSQGKTPGATFPQSEHRENIEMYFLIRRKI